MTIVSNRFMWDLYQSFKGHVKVNVRAREIGDIHGLGRPWAFKNLETMHK
jgi:hypothetical protein